MKERDPRCPTRTTTAGVVGPRRGACRGLSTVLRTMVLGVVVAGIVGLTSVQAQELSREYQLKAAFVFCGISDLAGHIV